MFPGWKIRRGYRAGTKSDTTDLLVTAEKRMARSLGAPVWRITGEFPFDKERLEKQPELCERYVIDALLAAMLKGPQGPTS